MTDYHLHELQSRVSDLNGSLSAKQGVDYRDIQSDQQLYTTSDVTFNSLGLGKRGAAIEPTDSNGLELENGNVFSKSPLRFEDVSANRLDVRGGLLFRLTDQRAHVPQGDHVDDLYSIQDARKVLLRHPNPDVLRIGSSVVDTSGNHLRLPDVALNTTRVVQADDVTTGVVLDLEGNNLLRVFNSQSLYHDINDKCDAVQDMLDQATYTKVKTLFLKNKAKGLHENLDARILKDENVVAEYKTHVPKMTGYYTRVDKLRIRADPPAVPRLVVGDSPATDVVAEWNKVSRLLAKHVVTPSNYDWQRERAVIDGHVVTGHPLPLDMGWIEAYPETLINGLQLTTKLYFNDPVDVVKIERGCDMPVNERGFVLISPAGQVIDDPTLNVQSQGGSVTEYFISIERAGELPVRMFMTAIWGSDLYHPVFHMTVASV